MFKKGVNKKIICIICVILLIYALYLGYKSLKPNIKEGWSPNTHWNKWNAKVCIDKLPEGGHSRQEGKLERADGDWAEAVEKCLSEPSLCNGGNPAHNSPSIEGASIVNFYPNNHTNTNYISIKNDNKIAGSFFLDQWASAWGVVQKSNDLDCVPPPTPPPAPAAPSSAGGGGGGGGTASSSGGYWDPPYSHWCTDEPGQSKQEIVLKGLSNEVRHGDQASLNTVIKYCAEPGNCGNNNNISPELNFAAGDDAVQSEKDGGWHWHDPWVEITRNNDPKCTPRWRQKPDDWRVECLPTKDGPGNAILWAEIENIKGGQIFTNELENSDALEYCLDPNNSDKCGAEGLQAGERAMPNVTRMSDADANAAAEMHAAARVAGRPLDPTSDKYCWRTGRCNAFDRHGYIFAQDVEQCLPYWGKKELKGERGNGLDSGWQTECQESKNGMLWPAITFSPLKNCTGCGLTNSIPDKIASVQACIDSAERGENKCGPLPEGSTDSEARDAAVIGPHVVVTLPDAEGCHPQWMGWSPKQCIGYKTSMRESKLMLPAPDKWPDIGRSSAFPPGPINHLNTDAAAEGAVTQLCAASGSCGGPENHGTPEYYGSDDISGNDQNLLGHMEYSTAGIGERIGKIIYTDDTELCQPTFRPVEKTKARFGIAKYEPNVDFKLTKPDKPWDAETNREWNPRAIWNADVSDCEALIRDISFTSIKRPGEEGKNDKIYTWDFSENKILCDVSDPSSCQTSEFLASLDSDDKMIYCYSPPSVDGHEKGYFIKRDSEYATLGFGDLMNPSDTWKGFKQYSFPSQWAINAMPEGPGPPAWAQSTVDKIKAEEEANQPPANDYEDE